MRILVTGSEGRLGQAVIRKLFALGHEIRGADRAGLRRSLDYPLHEGDLVSPEMANVAVRGVDAVIQLAAQVYGVKGFHQWPADILSDDITLHRNILDACIRFDVRKIAYVSSSMVYESCRHMPLTEIDPDLAPAPHSGYGLAKFVNERLCRAYHEQYGLKFVIWRPFNIIDPSERAEEAQGISHVFADLIKMIVTEKRTTIPLLGDGEQVRCFTWIDDVADAIARWSFEEQTDGETFNLGTPEPITIWELASKIHGHAQKAGLIPPDSQLIFEHENAIAGDVKVRIPDVTKAKLVIGWQPKVMLDQALRFCVEAAGEPGSGWRERH